MSDVLHSRALLPLIPPAPFSLERGGIRRQIVNRFRSTERTGRSVGIMIMEGSRDTEDGMARTPTERLLQQQIQTLFPRLSRHWRRALARWVLGALLVQAGVRFGSLMGIACAGGLRLP